MKLDVEKWTLLHDGSHRHGIMTTNISEALNSVLKKARYFHQHREEAENCVHPFPTRIFDKFLRIELKSREHKVTTYNPQEGIYIVKSPIRVSGTGNNVYTLRLNNKFCSCEKWQTYTLPCSHVLAVRRENGSRIDAYVSEIYSRQTYIKTYQANFHPILSENFWRDVPFNLTFYPPNKKKERDRKQGKRFQGEMDYRNPDSSPRCGRCRMPGHNRKNCNNPGPSNV
ncbi:hypothetical protein M9H77_20826 [Catharanthus roseus]|uniref:Uncharacterized protein n=1 Tax=Catharanthus roseus TaxID=4058 RepID=A0ACC0ANH4_CATRO|nr:hypothetical protein M9H77_20826 [Catharanthus roseus]